MNEPLIQRFSSRTHRLDQTILTQYLKQAKRYHRIAGYFTSSLFEIAGEYLDGIDDVRIVCNSDVRSEDIKVAKIQEAKLLGRLNSLPVEADSLLNRPRYQWLYEFLGNHPNAIRVAPDDFCGFVHGKAGVIELRDGRRIGFMGSMNETRAGWQSHYEIVWSDESPEGVDWIQAEFDALWAKAVPLPRAVVQEVGRRAHRVEIELDEQSDLDSLAPAVLVESPMYREGLSLSPWQRAFVTECLKHLRWHGVVRLLIADEVGLGKTLSLATAALTLTLIHEQEVAQRGPRSRRRPIAIFAPATLTGQWQTELIDKLGLPCARWSSQKKVWLDPEERAISPTGPENVVRCPLRIGIISTGLIVQPTRERDLLNQVNFEILILDESHKSRTKQGLGNGVDQPNALLQFMLDAAGRSKHVLLGTATPMQTRPEDLWDQLRILHRGDGRFVLGNDFSPWHHPERVVPVVTGEEQIDDPEVAWRYLRSPLPPLESSKESDFRRVIHEIRGELGMTPQDFDTAASLVDLPLAVRDDLEHLLDTERANMRFFQRHNPIVRHVVLRKRKVLEEAGLLPKVGVDLHPNPEKCRDPNTVAILFQQRGLRTDQAFVNAYEAALAFGQAYGRRVGGSGFMKNLVTQRLCSSCVAGLNTAHKLLDRQTLEDENELELGQDIELAIAEQEALHDLINALQDMQGEDPKLKAVKHYLTQENWLEHGCIIFSQYYDTAAWVAENLAALFPDQLVGIYAGADKSALFRGPDIRNREKRETLKKMVEDQNIRIMVATDAACEGLNLQRLGTLINVDLPWNPTRLEQRIGRIKRFGQTRSTVDMLNLVYQDTVDETIYERLSARMKDRFDLFGSLPDTIEDTWIENIETLDEKLDEYIDAQRRVNGFDIRYNENLDAEEDEWRNCARVLSRRSIENLMRNGW
ncbi:phospholipase D-like domain-containing anti-phage protein [Prochlorothrix hollandica]|uniref:Helicase n=1 Tax=Prochlorothrix hollandica PCC 9006 = CALU 1027 TaxID=317619 RepID=A0A0M2PSQ9_PROHO|nr:phospholipase D-like domain-containing anti-phage protein [Prochlorothrix hollandica]KKI99565.1 helicase [Prochlorothrix hollandica PCC 9006 = CALU 1027]